MVSSRQRPWWPGAVLGAVAFGAVASVPGALVQGGLAPIAVAALVAGAVGVPIARAEWRSGRAPRDGRDRAADALGEVLLPLWIAASWAVVWPGAMGGALAVALWFTAFGAVRLRADFAVLGLAAIFLLQVALSAALGAVEAAPWTLLVPRWDGWSGWLGWSLVTGLLLAGAGASHWSRGAEPPPGGAHVPWLPAGLGLLALLGVACRSGSRFEADLGWVTDPLALGVVALALGTAATATLAPERAHRPTVLGFGAGASAWFALPGSGAVEWATRVWLPLGLVLILASRARRDGRFDPTALLGLGLAALALWLGWPGVPPEPPAAVASALTGVGLAWVAGTRALVAR